MRVLVLGSSGFVGRHVVGELARRGAHVESWSRAAIGPLGAALHRRVDLLEPPKLAGALGPWDAAVLLAGHAVPGAGFTAERARENIAIACNALAHVAQHSPRARVIVMSSAHVYGDAGGPDPIDEEREPAPTGAYGVSKLEVEKLAAGKSIGARASELEIAIVRSFNLIGPRMPPGLLVPDVLETIKGGADPLRMRGADGVRDFLDVRDGARAIAGLVETRTPDTAVFNLCSGHGTRVSAIVAGLAQRLGGPQAIRFREGSPAPAVGSHARLGRATGWAPEIPLDATLDWIAAEARETS